MSEKERPIGVFDSGLGGLTVVRRLMERRPAAPLLYLADQAHVPYGGRELVEVCGFAQGISRALIEANCCAIVMACNISSAVALETVQERHPDLPILGVILPGAEAAAGRTGCGRIGVLATDGTVRSGAYTRALQALDPELQVVEVACPAFVPLVEAGCETSPEAYAAAAAYLAPLDAAGVDVVILGCTHYPFLLPVLRDLRPGLLFLDPAEQTVCALERRLDFAPDASAPSLTHRFLTTGDPSTFSKQLHRFLPEPGPKMHSVRIGRARWHDGELSLI